MLLEVYLESWPELTEKAWAYVTLVLAALFAPTPKMIPLHCALMPR